MSQLLQPYAWGIQRLKLDKASLAQGTLRVLKVSAVFPSGELYSAPEGVTLPSAIGLQDLPLSVSEITTYLALPRLNPHGRNLVISDSCANAGRYAQYNEQTADMFNEAEESEVAFLAPAVRLLTEDQTHDAFEVIPIARLKRSSTGGFEVDDRYMAPAVNLAAMPSLMIKLRKLLEALDAKVQVMQETHREPSQNVVEFRAPSAIPVRPGMLYFALEPRGSLYEHMLKSQTVTVYIPNGLSELKLELLALMP